MFLVRVKPRLMLVFISVTLGMLVEAFKGRGGNSLKSDYIFTIYLKLFQKTHAHSRLYVALNLVSYRQVFTLFSQM